MRKRAPAPCSRFLGVLRDMFKRLMLSLLTMVAAAVVVEAGPIKKHPRPIPGLVHRRPQPRPGPGADDEFSTLPSVEEVTEEMLEIHGKGRLQAPLQARAQGFSRPPERGAGRSSSPTTTASTSSRRTASSTRRRPDGRHLGPRPHRPARPAARRELHLQPDRGLRFTPTSSTPACAPPTRVRRPGRGRLHRDQRRQRHEPTATATAPTWRARSAGTTYGVAKNVDPARGARARLQRLRHRRAGVIAGIDWVTQNHDRARPSPT